MRATDRNAPGHGRRTRNGYADRPHLPARKPRARGLPRGGPCRGSAGQFLQRRHTARAAADTSAGHPAHPARRARSEAIVPAVETPVQTILASGQHAAAVRHLT